MRMFTQILVRARVDPLSILKPVRAALIEVDPEQQAMKTRDLNEWITTQPEYARQRLVASLFGIFSVLALVLSAIGLYSVVSYTVASRMNEFGVRIALGARRMDVMRIVFAMTSTNVGAGLIAGIILAVVLGRVEAQWLSETASARDPMLLLGVSVLLAVAAAIASFLPAHRAASVDPMTSLRYE
jgi:ABC-type antimicrobial peptide transport system permease subunit